MSGLNKQDLSGKWCILRTSGGRTLPLLRSLVEAGLSAWSPIAVVAKRKPRRPGRVEQPAAMMPTFVFAPAEHLAQLHALSRSPINPHPAFSVFKFDGRIPLLGEREIERMREEERRAVPKRRRRTIAEGTTVRPDQGPYAGMSGVVKSSNGKYTLVAFGGWMEVQIETFTIATNEIEAAHPTGIAA